MTPKGGTPGVPFAGYFEKKEILAESEGFKIFSEKSPEGLPVFFRNGNLTVAVVVSHR